MNPNPNYARLIQYLGDTPTTVISTHLLQRGLGDAYWADDPSQALWVQSYHNPAEPTGFGGDAAALWDVLQTIPGWRYPSVDPAVADDLAALMERDLGVPVRHYADIHHTLTRPAPRIAHPDVRLLDVEDVFHLEISEVAAWCGFGGPEGLLQEGFAAAPIVDGQIVGLAQTYARTPYHADIGISILEPFRRRGYALAACALVCQAVQSAGQTPVWSTGEDNHASLALAQKLGFAEVAHRLYLIPTATY